MNGNQLDELFKQKLGNQKLTPPTSSWDQIENNLKENKSKGIALWIKIAASFILLFTIGWLILPTEKAVSQKSVATIVEEVESVLTSTTQTASESKEAPALTSTEVIVPTITKTQLANSNPLILLVQSDDSLEGLENEVNTSFQSIGRKEIAMLKLALPTPNFLVIKERNSQVLPMDVSLMYTYASDRNEEVKKSKKFRMLNGIISIAKGVNKSKLGFEDIRNAKNGFVNDELKYGAKETEDVVEENDTKSDELNK